MGELETLEVGCGLQSHPSAGLGEFAVFSSPSDSVYLEENKQACTNIKV
jgi:hypothetical protein